MTTVSNENNNNVPNDDIDFRDLIRGIIRKKKWGITTSTLLFIFIAAETINQRIVNPIYQGSFTILISDPFSPNKRGNTELIKGRAPSYQSIANTSNKYDLNTLIRLLKSPIFLGKIAEEFNMSPIGLSNAITIKNQNPNKPLNQAGVLDIKLSTNNREKGLLLMEALSESFLKESLLRKQQKLNDGLAFLKAQAPTIKKEEENLQRQLVSFRKKHNLIDPLIESKTIKERQAETDKMIIKLNTLINRLQNVRLEIINGTMTARGFREQIGKELGSDFVVNDLDQGILSQLISLEKEMAFAKLKFTSDSSIVQGLKKKLEEIKPFLLNSQLESIDTAIKLTKARLSDTYLEKSNLEQQFLRHPSLIKEYQEIVQKLNFANENLLNLNAAINKFELDLAQSRIPWTIISSPRMGTIPIKPNIKRTLSRGLIVSLFLGLIIALLRDKLDNVFHTTKEVNEYLKLPFLGNLPYLSSVKDLRNSKSSLLSNLAETDKNQNTQNSYYYENFYMSEALRNIYTSIRFLNSDKPLKTIVIASSIPKEGKSLINILLSKIFCDMGEKVLLIDSDLRKPQIHERLAINNLLGLSDYLVNNNNNLKDVIQPIKSIKNLSVITAGSKVPDPTRLLNSQRFDALLNELNESKNYDCILFDSPPVLGLADSLLISKKVDGLIMLVSLDFVNKTFPKDSVNRLVTNNTNILGLITNSIEPYTNKALNKYDNFYNYNNGYDYINYLPAKEYSNSSQESSSEDFNSQKLAKSSKLKKIINFILLNKRKLMKWLDT